MDLFEELTALIAAFDAAGVEYACNLGTMPQARDRFTPHARNRRTPLEEMQAYGEPS